MQPARYVPLDGGAATWSPEEVSASTVAATAVATGHHMLKVEGYSRLKVTHGDSGRYIESSAFKVGGHTWKIHCYLNGNRKENAGFVSVFLHLCSDPGAPAVVHAECEFALVPHQDTPPPAHGHHQGNKSPSTTSHGVRWDVRAFGDNGANGCSWGPLNFISVKKLEHSMFLKDDCFAVRCTVTVVRERTVKEKAVQPHDMARLGMLCNCDDDLCKRHHARPAAAETFLERFANFCYSICRGGGGHHVRITL